MMRAMPYKLQQQGKGVVDTTTSTTSLVSQIPPKWKSLDQFQQQQQQQLQVSDNNNINNNNSNNNINNNNNNNNNNSSRATSSSVESEEPTSTLDTTRRSPSPPTSTSTLSSSFDNTPAGVADPACVPELHHTIHSGSGNAAAAGGGGGGVSGGGGSGIGLEEWDSMFPNGDGALLPWIMGDPDDPGLGLKHLLQSGNPSVVVEYEGNAGLGVVDQVSSSAAASSTGLGSGGGGGGGYESLSPPQSQTNASHHHMEGGFGGNGKVGGGGGSVSPNCVPTNGLSLNPNHLLGGSIGVGGGGLSFPHQFDDEKPQIFNPQMVVMNQQQAHSMSNPSFVMSPNATLGFCQQFEQFQQPQAKRHNPGVVLDPNLLQQVAKNPFLNSGHLHMGLQHMPIGLPPLLVQQHLQQQQQQQKPVMMAKAGQNHHFPMLMHQQQQQLQEQSVKDQLFKAADLIQTGTFSLAQEILARLNHQLSLPAKPLIRVAMYVKEALQMLLQLSNPVAAPPPKTLTPYDVVHKMNAYKVFSEVSPITQFVNFTCTQAILEALDDADVIHIVDFDIGCGAQWASLIQELPLRKRGAPSLKITAVAPLSTTHPFELALVRENLVQFANDTGVSFELQIANLDSFEPSTSSIPNFRTSEDEAIAFSVPIWSCSTRPSIFPLILRFIKQRSPKIVVSLDRGFDRCDVPFPQHLIHSLESCTNFLESLDGVPPEVVSKVEKFFVQPRIESTVLGRLHAPDKMPHWKNLFASAGFMPLQFSNFTETQADYVVKRTPGSGFHVEKRQASLLLSWQRRELVAASAWRC